MHDNELVQARRRVDAVAGMLVGAVGALVSIYANIRWGWTLLWVWALPATVLYARAAQRERRLDRTLAQPRQAIVLAAVCLIIGLAPALAEDFGPGYGLASAAGWAAVAVVTVRLVRGNDRPT